jgi:hypothetical protein
MEWDGMDWIDVAQVRTVSLIFLPYLLKIVLRKNILYEVLVSLTE